MSEFKKRICLQRETFWLQITHFFKKKRRSAVASDARDATRTHKLTSTNSCISSQRGAYITGFQHSPAVNFSPSKTEAALLPCTRAFSLQLLCTWHSRCVCARVRACVFTIHLHYLLACFKIRPCLYSGGAHPVPAV